MTRKRAVAVGLFVVLVLAALLLAILVTLNLIGDRQPDPYLWDGISPVSSP
jgi:ABC-type transporter Mla subunit MlaD